MMVMIACTSPAAAPETRTPISARPPNAPDRDMRGKRHDHAEREHRDDCGGAHRIDSPDPDQQRETDPRMLDSMNSTSPTQARSPGAGIDNALPAEARRRPAPAPRRRDARGSALLPSTNPAASVLRMVTVEGTIAPPCASSTKEYPSRLEDSEQRPARQQQRQPARPAYPGRLGAPKIGYSSGKRTGPRRRNRAEDAHVRSGRAASTPGAQQQTRSTRPAPW